MVITKDFVSALTYSVLHWTPYSDTNSDSIGVEVGVGVVNIKIFGTGIGVGIEGRKSFGVGVGVIMRNFFGFNVGVISVKKSNMLTST